MRYKKYINKLKQHGDGKILLPRIFRLGKNI